MSSQQQQQQQQKVANVTRRTWDIEAYEKRAQQRAQNESNDNAAAENVLANSNKEEFKSAPRDRAGPEGSDRAFLKARTNKVDVDSKIGEQKLLTDGVTGNDAIGWHCKVCDCVLKDSHTYLDHINGRKHQRKLGYTMRVERSTKEQIEDRLKNVAKIIESNNKNKEETDLLKMVQDRDAEEAQKKEEKKRKRKERKEQKKAIYAQQDGNDDVGDEESFRVEVPTKVQNLQAHKSNGNGHSNVKLEADAVKQEAVKPDDADEEYEEAPQVDPALAAMMGFSSFG